MGDCLFCSIVAKNIPSSFIFEDGSAVVFKDINPKAPTHLLVVPKKHIGCLAASTEDDAELLGHLQRVAVQLAASLGLESFRLVTNNGRGAGQTVDHLHYHLLGGRAMQWPPG